MDLKEIFEKDYIGKKVKLQGWIKNHRRQKEFGFIDFSDGTVLNTLQVVYTNELKDFNEITKLLVGSAISIEGEIVKSEGKQAFELKLEKLEVLSSCPEDYPIQPKRHTREFLREVAYLRPRTNLFNAIFRVRNRVSYAIHTYFQSNNYIYVHTPIITGVDCEGAGEAFQVTTLPIDKIKGEVDYKKDFFGKKVALTVSGQLQVEPFAHAFKKVYTFGPTFRAENSHTKIHAAEFWMVEPEIAFCDLNGLMDIEEECLKYIIKDVLENCKEEMKLFDSFVEKGLIDKLNNFLKSDAARITHKEAIDLLLNSGKKWEFTPNYESDIASEHEKYLTDEYFKKPVFITDWPKDIKAFYMKLNEDNKTVAASDLLVPGGGELMGGSQREDNLEKLEKMMKEKNAPIEDLYWYTNLRKYGGVYHSGFGIGFDRLLIYLTGVDNIRDTQPYPRTSNNCDF